jgi:hypothetical protein
MDAIIVQRNLLERGVFEGQLMYTKGYKKSPIVPTLARRRFAFAKNCAIMKYERSHSAHPWRRISRLINNEGSQTMPSKTTRINYRRADTGVFTTETYARKHPKTTVKETVKAPPQKKPSSGKKKK